MKKRCGSEMCGGKQAGTVSKLLRKRHPSTAHGNRVNARLPTCLRGDGSSKNKRKCTTGEERLHQTLELFWPEGSADGEDRLGLDRKVKTGGPPTLAKEPQRHSTGQKQSYGSIRSQKPSDRRNSQSGAP